MLFYTLLDSEASLAVGRAYLFGILLKEHRGRQDALVDKAHEHRI
jgi:hypothetical protein